MDYRTVFEVSTAGMNLEKRRLDFAALNLANMHTSSASETGAYKPLRVVASPLRIDFARLMEGAGNPSQLAVLPRHIEAAATSNTPRLIHDPGHPHADAQGMVRYPGVDQAKEMLTAMTALRAYEANVAAASLARAMAIRALELGGR
jgi:flagellar basal-body rod protein FlgC